MVRLVLVLLVAGCGGGSGGSGGIGDDDGGGWDDTRGQRLADAYCDRMLDCCTPAEMNAENSVFQLDGGGCRLLFETVYDGAFFPMLEDGEAAGTVEVDWAAFDQCIELISHATCEEIAAGEAFAPCENVIQGQIADGSQCNQGFECRSGYCANVAGDNATCGQRPGGGDACNGTCAQGYYCDTTCLPQKPNGQACSDSDECADGGCVGGVCAVICDGGGPGAGPADGTLAGVGPRLVDAACGARMECCTDAELAESSGDFGVGDDEDSCRLWTSLFAGVLLAYAHQAAEDGNAVIHEDVLDQCLDDYASMSCEEYARYDSPSACDDWIEGRLADGEPCAIGFECSGGACEGGGLGDPGVCSAIPAGGEACTGTCADGFFCNGSGLCQTQVAAGETCSGDDECAEGDCAETTCTLICDGR